MAKIIGVSGKIGSGKDYLTGKLITEMQKRNFTTTHTSFATPLKVELDEIITIVRENASTFLTANQLNARVATKMNMSIEDAALITSALSREVTKDLSLNAYSRTYGIRDALQKLGTEVRRKQNPDYWTQKFISFVGTLTVDFVFVSDARFPNEMDTVVDNDGFAIRINLTPDVLEKRRANRDGIIYTAEQLNHVSETALDDYTRFSLFVGETFEVAEIADQALSTI